jgi:uncharacterized protein
MTRSVFLSAEWRYLLMLNYEVEPRLLASSVPAGTELDFYDGRCFVSVVGFRFLKTKVLGWAIPFHRNFEEVNLRFYVRRRTPEGWRRGVVFVREIVPRLGIALVARTFYGEPYSAMPMRHELRSEETKLRIAYAWRRAEGWESISASVEGEPYELSPGSLEEFITEHYWGYTARPWGCSEYEVEHPRWKIWNARDAVLHAEVATLYGETFQESLSAPPASAFLAEGSPVVVRQGGKIVETLLATRGFRDEG